jgi:hypothetical protein
MARSCQVVFGSRAGAAEWSYDGSHLQLAPASGAPIVVALPEIAGISGDGYGVTLRVSSVAGTGPGPTGGAAGRVTAELSLAKLGAEGPTLLERLRREWLVARAGVLRLGGSGEAKAFYGRVTGLDTVPAAPEAFQALLFEDVLVVARDGRDLEPLFLALFGSIEFDDPAYSVRVRQWPGQEVTFSKMAGQTDEFLKCLRENRAVLAQEASVNLGAAVPKLPAGGRAALAGMWLPGRLMEVDGMEAVCPGFGQAFRGEWLERLARKEEGRHLLDLAAGGSAGGSAWLGCTREQAEAEGASEGEQPLWLLCGKNGVWFLEALTIGDRATYCFAGGDEVPPLVSRLLCAPEFSKEALYAPLEELTGDSADLAVPAQFLGFLVELRKRFKSRVIHQSVDGWRADVEGLTTAGA